MTRPLLPAGIALALCAPALAQPNVACTLSFTEVIAGTTTPVGTPNGVIEPGEAARIRITAGFTPPVGSVLPLPPPLPFGNGTVVGLGYIWADLVPNNAGAGTWSNFVRRLGFGGPGPSFEPATSAIFNIQAAQSLSAAVIIPDNPVVDVWTGVWRPTSYAPRTVVFLGRGAAAGSPGDVGSLVLRYIGPFNEELNAGTFTSLTFGEALTIPVIPSPAPAAVLALAAATFARRRTRKAAQTPLSRTPLRRSS